MPFEMGGRRWYEGQRVRVVYPGYPLDILGTIEAPYDMGGLDVIRVRLDAINYEQFPEEHTTILVEAERLEPLEPEGGDLA